MEILKYHCDTGLCNFNTISSHNIITLVSLRNTIATSSAEAERSFSYINSVKCIHRASINDERTSDLSLLTFENDLTKSLDLLTVVDEFAAKRACRVPLN